MHKLVVSNGLLVGYFLYGEEAEPPPCRLTQVMVRFLFDNRFRQLQDEAVTDSLPLFQGQERWPYPKIIHETKTSRHKSRLGPAPVEMIRDCTYWVFAGENLS